ncbi:MAG TPA: hypothetical protein VJ732_00315 [Bryobacteraceae bacterium]|nr:hypothetical protein [Bryobacteraceae bacterium]
MTTLAAWQNFYVIAGSSAGALIGLQFVVLSLISGLRAARVEPKGAGAFATPTIVHFGAVLLLSGMVCAPWQGIAVPSLLWGLEGAAGAVYALLVIRRIRAQRAYRPQFEDWLFHVLLPLAAYLILAASGYTARFRLRETLFALGAAALLLLFSGIHNAWDAVTYHIFEQAADNAPSPPR